MVKTKMIQYPNEKIPIESIKSFEISILKATLSPGIFLESTLMTYEVIPIQSLMCQPLIKPF